MKKLLQSYLASKGLYSGPVDGELSLEFLLSIEAYLGTDVDGWDNRRIFVAGLQKMVGEEGLYHGEVDGSVNPAANYALAVYAARMTGQPEPPKQTFEAPKPKRAAPPKPKIVETED